MSCGRNHLAPHPLLSVFCDSLSPSFAALNLGRHLGWLGPLPWLPAMGRIHHLFDFPGSTIIYFALSGTAVALTLRKSKSFVFPRQC